MRRKPRRNGETNMALTRKLLEGMGIDEKQIETIIEAHSETVNGLKAERDSYKEEAGKLPDLQKELEDARKVGSGAEAWKVKFEDAQKALEEYTTKVEAEKAETRKRNAYRDMLAHAGIDPRLIPIIMKGETLSGIEMEGDTLKDADSLEQAVKEQYADFVLKERVEGAGTATPPKGTDGGGADPDVARMMQERGDRMYGKINKEA